VTEPVILEPGEIGAGEIEALLTDAADVVRIRAFTDPDAAVRIARRLERHPSHAVYRNTGELERVGESHFETHDASGVTDPDALAAYLDAADRLMAEIRGLCAPDESPFDALWQMLTRTLGIERAVLAGRCMFAGIVRIFPEGSELLPHNDDFARDAPGLDLAASLQGQLAVNVYLETPARGGELELWRWRPTHEQLARVRRPDSGYGADRSLLPAPDVTVGVAPGDLVMFDAARVHAVRRQAVGRRIGVSCFLGYRRGLPLVCWS
jgi:hypothetical protein